jgi:Spy/CpxP family protein refolding chaperone
MNNFTNNRWLSVVTLLLLTANIVTLALLWTNKNSGKERKGPPPPAGQVFEFITHELNLDSTQQEAYKKLRDEHQALVRPLQDSVGKAKDNFFALLQVQPVADTTVQAYSVKIGALEQQLDLITFKHFQKLRALCNATQQEKFDHIIQEAMHRMAPPKQQGPPPGRRPEEGGPPPPGMKPGDEGPPPPPGN